MYKKIFLLFIILLLGSACSSKKTAVKPAAFEAEAAFREVNEKIKGRYYKEAREALENIKTQDTSGRYAALAQIRIGDTYFEEGLYEEAAAEYERFLKIHPYHKYAYYAQYQLAMSYFRMIKTADVSYGFARRALKEFENLQMLYPRNPYMDVIEGRIRVCKNILAEYEFYVGQFYFKKGSYNAAKERFNQLLQNYPGSKKEIDTFYYLGLSYAHLGNRDKAREVLIALIEKYPAAKQSGEARKLIASFLKSEK